MPRITIAITGLNAADIPCPGISVIRCLREEMGQDVKIIGLAYELLCSTSYADSLIDEVYSLPMPQEDEDRYLSRMAEIAQKTKIDVLLPNLDFEIAAIARLESELRDIGFRVLVPSESAVTQCKKENLPRLAQSLDIDCPRSVVIHDQRQISTSAAYFTYPLIVKAATGEACLVYSLEEAIVFSKQLASLWGWPLILQEFIKGDEYCVACLSDRRQEIVGSVCMKKLLKSKSGTAWMGVTAKEDDAIDLARKITERLKWVGPSEIEFIKETSTGRLFLIEINPRFPSWIQLAAKAGCNLPVAAVKVAMRQKIEPFLSYKSGILFARSAMDITCDVSRLGQLATRKELIYHEDKK